MDRIGNARIVGVVYQMKRWPKELTFLLVRLRMTLLIIMVGAKLMKGGQTLS